MTFSDIIHNQESNQFKMTFGDAEAFINYSVKENKYYLNHAEVPYQYQGQGIGQKLVEKTFEYLESNKIEAVAVCSCIRKVARLDSKWQKFSG